MTARRPRPLAPAPLVALAAGCAALVVAVGSPLRTSAEADVGAHMVQHLLLTSIAAPLLAVAARDPSRLLPWPGSARWVHRWSGALAALVGLAYAAVLWGWHLPVLYDAALASTAVHALEHLTMLAAGVALWAVVLAAGRGVSHVAAFAVLVPTAIHSAALGSVLTFAPRPLYAGAPEAGAGALADQQLAGTLMWGVGGVPFVAAAAFLVASWLRRAEERSRHRAAVRAAVAARAMPVVALAALAGVACSGSHPGAEAAASRTVEVPGGDVDAGRRAIAAHGCGACHDIPGVPGADAQVAPPLTGWSRRSFIAGTLPNRPDELVRWIQDPQEVEPGTAMPDLDVDEDDARDIAAYLLSLE